MSYKQAVPTPITLILGAIFALAVAAACWCVSAAIVEPEEVGTPIVPAVVRAPTPAVVEASSSGLHIDAEDFYTDASDACVVYSGDSVFEPYPDLRVNLNCATRPLTDESYIANTIPMTIAQLEDMKTAEEEVWGCSGDVDVEAVALSKLQATKSTRHSPTSSPDLCAAIAPAVIIPNWEEEWTVNSDHNQAFWQVPSERQGVELQRYSNFNSYGKPFYIDLMLVNESSVPAYLSGDPTVTVTYVEVVVADIKAHAYPWGVSQTGTTYYVGKQQGTALQQGNSIPYRLTENANASYLDFWKDMLRNVEGATLDYFPTLHDDATSKGNVHTTASNVASDTFAVLELYKNTAASSYSQWVKESADDPLILVGVLVF